MEKCMLFQGDSITDAGRSYTDDMNAGYGYATMVKGAIGYAEPGVYRFYNRGVSGNRVVDLYARIKRDIINLKPDVMSILIGVNDVWHEIDSGNGVDAPKFERIYNMLIDEIKEALPDVKIIVLAPFVLPGTATRSTDAVPDKWERFTSEVALRAEASRRVAEQHGLAFVELQSLLDAACAKADPSYWLYDGVHPTAMGHALIADAWLKAYRAMK